MTGDDFLRLDPKYDGACPCAAFVIDDTEIEVHCWRTCFACEFSGVHYLGDRAVAERVCDALNALGWSHFDVAEWVTQR